jgi:hypothetical protein
MLRVGRTTDNGDTLFALSGRIEERHISELRELIETESKQASVAFDLEEVRLVDRKAVGFLAACEAQGIKLRNCPSYIREWIGTRSDLAHES